MVYPVHLVERGADGRDVSDVVSTRRYSEFEDLHATLQRRFGHNGMLVPSLPPKAGWGTGERVVSARVRALSLFCADVLANPFLADDASWRAFTTPDEKPGSATVVSIGQLQWDQAVEAAVTARPALDDSDFGDVPTVQERDEDDVFAAALQELDALDAVLRRAQAASEAAALTFQRAAKDLDELAAATQAWAQVEQFQMAALRGSEKPTLFSLHQPDDATPPTSPAAPPRRCSLLRAHDALDDFARTVATPLPDVRRRALWQTSHGDDDSSRERHRSGGGRRPRKPATVLRRCSALYWRTSSSTSCSRRGTSATCSGVWPTRTSL
jgi:hypothetical protein